MFLKYANWPCLTFFERKSLTYCNQVGGDWKRVSCHVNKMFYSRRCVYCITISLPSFNGVHSKLGLSTSCSNFLKKLLQNPKVAQKLLSVFKCKRLINNFNKDLINRFQFA